MATGKIELVFGYDSAYVKFPNGMAFMYGREIIDVPAQGVTSVVVTLPINFENVPTIIVTTSSSSPDARAATSWWTYPNTIQLYACNKTSTAVSGMYINWFIIGKLVS